MSEVYDRIGVGYARFRRPEPAIVAHLDAALGDAHRVLNVGAGTGSYEPEDREVTAVEPSRVMIEQRPPEAAPAIAARAEDLPFEPDSFDAAMAILSAHHWADLGAGLTEMRRVARDLVLLLTIEPEALRDLWLVRDYFPVLGEIEAARMPGAAEMSRALPGADRTPVPVPRECTDMFAFALWGRPEVVLDDDARAACSIWEEIPAAELADGLRQLGQDLASGKWDERNGHLREAVELDVGLRLVSADVQDSSASARPPRDP